MGSISDGVPQTWEHDDSTDASYSLVKLINDYIKASEQKEFNSWRCSQIGRCPRSHFYKRLGIAPVKETTDRLGRVFSVGDVFHGWIQDIATKYTVNVNGSVLYKAEAEVEVFDKELDLGGRYDLLIDAKGEKILFDIKTVHSNKFTHMADEESPDWHYQMQLAAYMTLMKKLDTPVDKGRILYVSKDDLRTLELTYFLTPEKEKAVLDEVALLNKHWADKTLPPCTCDDPTHKTDWQRKSAYCDYSDLDKYGYVTVTSKSGRDYRKKEYNHCCDEKLFNDWKEKNV